MFLIDRGRSCVLVEFFFLNVRLVFSVFPMWGVLFSETIDLLFRPVFPCPGPDVPSEFETCADYWKDTADEMQERSFQISIYWACVFFGCIIGFVLNFWGFGMSSERLNKRVRDQCFEALMRQEVAYFGTSRRTTR